MKNSMRFNNRFFSLSLLVAGLFVCAGSALAGTYYWDANGTTAGFGTAGGTWGSDAYWSTDAAGVATPTAYTTTTSDGINFGYLSTGLASGTVTISGTQNAGTLTFASGSGTITLSGGTAINLAAASTITLNNSADTISTPISGAGTSLTKNGTGALTLSGANTYTGTTTIKAGTLQIGDGGGSLNNTTGTALTFDGSGTFNVKEADTVNQGMGTLSFNSGEGTVISTFNTTASTLTFSGMNARSAGATGNITISGGAASANKIVLTSNANAPLSSSGSNDRGIFYNLYTLSTAASFARYDTVNGYFRATSYSTPDLNATTTTTTYGSGVDLSIGHATISPGASVSLNTLRAVPTGNSQRYDVGTFTLSINGVLAVVPSAGVQFRVGSTTVGNGKLQPTTDGGEVVFAVARGDANALTTSSLAIANVIQDYSGGSQSTKVTAMGSATIVLQTTNTYSGVTTINSGYLRVLKWDIAGNASGLGTGGSLGAAGIVINGGALNFGNAGTGVNATTDRLFTIGPAGATLDCSGNSGVTGTLLIGSAGGNIAFSSSTAPATLTLANNAPAANSLGTGTLGAALGDPGTGANITSVIKTGAGTWQLAGTNTYSGNTTIISGGTLVLTSAGTLKFAPTANGVCNKITGAGTATLNGTFNIDLTNAALANGNAWTLVDVTTKNGSLTAVTGFTGSSGVWTKVDGIKTWTYTESTGVLSLAVTGVITYTVAFNSNGGSLVSTQTVNSGSTATQPADPTKSGNTFDGWYSDEGLTTSFSFSTPITADTTLYAKWINLSAVITLTDTLSAVNTTYGTASATPTSFHVSGSDLTGNLTVTPPSGYEVSLNSGTDYTTSLSITASGTLASTQVYVRLAATAGVGSSPHSGNITVSGGGATSQTIATAPSTVSPAELTLTANAQNKPYGTTQTTPVNNSAAFTPTGLKNGDTVGTVTLTYAAGGLEATDPVGNTSTITPSAAAGGTFTAGNYNIGYEAGTLTVVKATPTATLAVTNSPVTYDGAPHAALVGITVSSVPGEVQNILTGGASDQTAAGTYAVTADFVPTDTANYNTLTSHAAGNFIINNPPTSTGGSVTMRLNTTNTFAASNFQFSDTDGGTLGAIKVVTSLPTYGTLKMNGTPITEVPSAEILVATITNLTYTPNTFYVGADSFKFQVRDATAYSADATLAITVTSDITVQNGSFETPGGLLGGSWAMFGSPWSITGSPSNYQQIKAVEGGFFTNAPDGLWVGLINGDDCPITAPLTQNLGVSVTAGDTLTVTFQRGNPLVSAGGAGVAYFDVAGTKYTTAFDTSTLAAGGWQLTTMTHKITNSGNLTLGFYGTTGHTTNAWVDAISNITVTPEPPRGTVIILW